MGDTRCKHCGGTIQRWVSENTLGDSIYEWRHVMTDSLYCRRTVVTPEEVSRG